ncbi:hypothetical protein SUGI_0429070 [Cryptomeria japonica]|uniref:protein MIZU-KUSSEI 1 n=1 Tax=Cryptomeria japonica TaxID=3369 RepID=UPI002408E575|nr:protein MIZU-KUSSEI 1 [Cryptomeria japonica]GLJ22778.1 hypothetical protein SUGI_0429070 [Cryptomeria japonica]
MRKIIDLRGAPGMEIMEGSACVDCEKDVRFCCWPTLSFRSLMHIIVPRRSCQTGRASPLNGHRLKDSILRRSTVTGTIFGHRKGRVSLCIQEDSSAPPALLLELGVPTYLLAKEMHNGLLRIVLECDREDEEPCSLFSVSTWNMYFNGRKVGSAIKRHPTEADRAVLKVLRSISAGAGVMPKEYKAQEGDVTYMRATFRRVVGSRDSESFHLVNPLGSTSQELSIFLLRC